MLYKKRYLIAVYDKKDFCVGVYDNILDFAKIYKLKANSIYCAFKNTETEIKLRKYTIYFIDTLKVNNDIFADEDKIFKSEFKRDFLSNSDWCKYNNIKERTFYRKKAGVNNELQR